MTKKTVFVAVHGIGDQVKFSTIQSVARQVYGHYLDVKEDDFPRSLGAFHSALEQGEAHQHEIGRPYFTDELQEPNLASTKAKALGHIGFTEVFWADVARKNVDGYTLQETRAWVDFLAARLHLKQGADYRLAQQVLTEIGIALSVSNHVLALAKKVNLAPEFKLKKILDDFLGDVQFVAEYASVRDQIIDRFNRAMHAATLDEDGRMDPEVDLFIVAHSEGTVVALLGLLRAAATDRVEENGVPIWLSRVRGLATLGSPIDKHLLLWDELWPEANHYEGCAPGRIPWWNYYDRGDPVGYELDMARTWLRSHKYIESAQPLFEFTEAGHDFGYTRSLVPGKAHVDYWTDEVVFGHLLDRFAEPSPPPGRDEASAARTEAVEGPPTIRWRKYGSYALPYLLVFGLMYAAVYAIAVGLEEGKWWQRGIAWWMILGYTFPLAGTTIGSRIGRLARTPAWGIVCALCIFAGSVGLYQLILPQDHQAVFPWRSAGDSPIPVLGWLDLGIAALVVAVSSALLTQVWPSLRLKPLMFLGSTVTYFMAIATSRFHQNLISDPSPWPLLGGAFAFLCLWWFATLLFDLFFVWHRYVRFSTYRARTKAGEDTGQAPPR